MWCHVTFFFIIKNIWKKKFDGWCVPVRLAGKQSFVKLKKKNCLRTQHQICYTTQISKVVIRFFTFEIICTSLITLRGTFIFISRNMKYSWCTCLHYMTPHDTKVKKRYKNLTYPIKCLNSLTSSWSSDHARNFAYGPFGPIPARLMGRKQK